MAFGVVPEGFSRKLVSDLLTDIENDQRTNIDPLLNLLPDSVFGQMNGIYADRLRELWEVAEAVYNAWNPDAATGAALDAVAAITGALRLAATNSTVELTVELEAGTTLAIGRLVSSSVTGVQFTTIEAITNSTGSTQFLTVNAQSVDTGPVAGPAGSLTVIDTPVTGWLSVNNTLDAELGTNIETDDDFRIRREELLRTTGAATLEAIRAAVRALDGVVQAFVFENVTLVTDGNGLPGKAFEVVVSGGDNQEIADTIFATKPVGILAHGAVTEQVVDSQGFSYDIEFSRPAEKLIFVDVTVQYDPLLYPIDGDDQVKDAIVAEGAELLIGEDVIYVRFVCAPLEVAGVVDVTAYVHDPAPSVTLSGSTETFNLSGGEILDVLVDSEVIRQVTFQAGDFGTPGAATALEVAARIQTDIGAEVSTADVGGAVQITSVAGGSVLVSGGTANAALNFPTSITPASSANIVIGSRELARFDTSRINVTSVSI